ncbi:unnamed protein product [Caenorhabditis angaria]|uniref:Carboxylic ester hydrolase n=1 Tax=Caenorhabditis angaria TaxID=860376 RepID=A0A9P1I739_9PELO|nr:unnamed protein product [Caenorhabditis angaria]
MRFRNSHPRSRFREFSILILLVVLLFAPKSEARSLSSRGNSNVVRTSLGAIRGVGEEFQKTKVTAYLGVPFAKPPVGERRFKVAEMIEKWSGELEANKMAPTCFLTRDTAFPQFPGAEMWNPPANITEDCLHLNIWVPEHHDGTVMVWIYGGGFFSGTPSLDLYNGKVLAAKENTIVVNINYRLGAFGFLYFGDDSPIAGNMGLMDQQLAMRWVYEHIGAFGGDRDRITLFGESAGSASATAHLFAPGSHKYFRYIIAKSGSIINSWASAKPSTMLDLSMNLAKRVNCSSSSMEKMMKCLRNVDAHIIQEVGDNLTNGPPMTFAFVPVSSDVNFFQGDLFQKIAERDFKKDVDIIFGSVKDEGTYWLPYYMADRGFAFNHTITAEDPHNRALITRNHYRESMRAFSPYFANSELVYNAFMNTYEHVSKSIHEKERLRDGVARFLGDLFFTCSLIDFADLMADNVNGQVYMYYFTYRSSANPWPKWMGVMHGYEIEYAFGQPFHRPALYQQEYLREEEQLSTIVMDLWGQFAEGGKMDSHWPLYNRVERKALEIGRSTIEGEHRIVSDVHGSYCRMIEEAKAFVHQKQDWEKAPDCRTRRLDASAIQVASSSSSSTKNLNSIVLFLVSIFYYFLSKNL